MCSPLPTLIATSSSPRSAIGLGSAALFRLREQTSEALLFTFIDIKKITPPRDDVPAPSLPCHAQLLPLS